MKVFPPAESFKSQTPGLKIIAMRRTDNRKRLLTIDAIPIYVAHLKRRLNTFGFLEDLISTNNDDVL